MIQEEVKPGVWAGIFDQEEEAEYFLKRHHETGSDYQIEQLQLYRAELTQEKTGEDLFG